MGLRYLLGLCFALLSFSSLAAGLVESGFRPPLQLGSVSPGGVAGARVTASATSSLTSIQPRIGPVSVDMLFKRGLSNQGATLFARRALVASPPVFASLAAGNLILERNGYAWVDGGFVSINTDPSDPSSWGSAPEGVTYTFGGVFYSSISEAGQAAVDNIPEWVCEGSVGSCSLTGFMDAVTSQPCLSTLTDNCNIRPTYTNGSGNTGSSTWVGLIRVSNPTGGISCATGTYSVEHYGCYAFDDGAAVDLDTVAGDIEPSDIEDLSDSEIAGLVTGSIDAGIAANDDFWPDDDLIEVDIIPSSVEVDLGSTVSTEFIPPNNTEQVIVTEESALVEFDSPVYVPLPDSQSASDILNLPLSEQVSSSVRPGVGTVTLPSTETITSKTYRDGALISTGSTTNAGSNPIVRPADPSYAGSGSGTSDFVFPAFCSWASAICEWLDWTQEPLGEPEPDLSAILTDEDFERSYNISFGNSSCPEPISINIAFLNKDIDLSYEPACDLAGYAKPLVLISAYIFAIYIGLGVVRNG